MPLSTLFPERPPSIVLRASPEATRGRAVDPNAIEFRERKLLDRRAFCLSSLPRPTLISKIKSPTIMKARNIRDVRFSAVSDIAYAKFNQVVIIEEMPLLFRTSNNNITHIDTIT